MSTRGKRYIASVYLPPRFPLIATLVFWIFMDRYNAPSWVWGMVGTIIALAWLGTAIRLYKETGCAVPLGGPEKD